MILGTAKEATASNIKTMTSFAGDKTGTAFLELARIV